MRSSAPDLARCKSGEANGSSPLDLMAGLPIVLGHEEISDIRRGGIGRRAGLKIQKSPILSGYLSLKADHDFHRENELFSENSGEYRGTARRSPKVEQK